MNERMNQFDQGVVDAPSEGPNLFQIAWHRKALLLLGAAVGVVLGALYYAQQSPVYQSSAEVLVVQKRPETATPLAGAQSGMAYVEDYVTSQAKIIGSPMIVKRALASGSVPKGYAASDIIGSLTVNADWKDEVLSLSFRGRRPEECRAVLDAVIASYEQFLDETYKNVNEETLQQITEKLSQLRKDLQENESRYRKFLENKPLLFKNSDGATLQQERLAAIDAKRSEMRMMQAELASQIAALRAAVDKGEDSATLIALVENQLSKDATDDDIASTSRTRAQSLERELLPLLIKEKSLLEDFGADHPDVRMVRNQIQMTKDFYDRLDQIVAPESEDKTEEEQRAEQVEEYLRSMERKLEGMKTKSEALAELFKEEHSQAKEMMNYQFQDRQYASEIARDEKFYETLITQLQGVNLSKDLGGYTTSVIAPPTAGARVAPNPMRIFAAAIMLGLMGGFGLAYLAEVTDKSFRTPEEIRRRLGLPVVGQIPFIKSAGTEPVKAGQLPAPVDGTLCVHHRPRSQQAEAIRGVRTALYFNARGQGHKVVQVSSPDMGDGKTTTAGNLAISIAKAGQRVLLIDADLRKPRIHKMFGLSSEVGLASIISGEVEPSEAIQEGGVDNLGIIPCGRIPSNPAELLTSPRLEELLNVFRDEYDFVLVDTPPLLVVTDPSVVAPRVDTVLLTIRITKNGRSHAERAVEILETLGANILGVVVNQKEAAAGRGYGYGRYRYGYRGCGYGGYGYGGFGYGGYGYGVENPYYQDDEAPSNGSAESAPLLAAGGRNGRNEGSRDASSS